MAFIGVEHIGDRNPRRLHRAHDLVAFGLLDARIIGPLRDQQRLDDLVRLVERARRPQQREAFLGRGIAHAFVEHLHQRRPVGRNGGEQGFKVRGADNIDSAGKHFRREGKARQRRIAAIGTAHDRDPLGQRDPLRLGPVHRVDQIVVHLQAPLPVAGIEEGLAEPGRAAEVDAEDAVAAIGEQLVGGVEAIGIARPRAAMHQQHHRHRRGGPAGALRIAARRQSEVAGQGQAIAAGDLDRMHRLKRRALQFRAGGVEPGQRHRRAVENVVRQRARQRVVPDDPHGIVIGAAVDPEIALQPLAQPRERGGHGRIGRVPAGGEIGHRVGLDHAGQRVAQGLADIGAVVFGNQGARAGRSVLREQRGGVTPAAVDPVERTAVGGVARRRGGQRVFHRRGLERLGRDHIVLDPEVIRPPARILLHRHAQGQGVIGLEPGMGVVFQHQRQRPGGKVEQMDIVPLRIAVVEADQQLVLDRARRANQIDAGVRKRGERGFRACGDVDAVEQEILVPALVLNIHQRAGIG